MAAGTTAMARVIRDGGLCTWEVFATTGPFGYARPARLVFLPRSEPGMRSRIVEYEGDHAAAERAAATLSSAELLALLDRAVELP